MASQDAAPGSEERGRAVPSAESDTDPPRPVEEYPLPPGPDGYPLIGNTVALLRDPFAFYDRLDEYGDVVRYEAAGNAYTTLLHPAYVEQVLVEEPDRFERWSFTDVGIEFAPEGLLAIDHDDRWRRQRTVMQPAFTLDRIRSYADTMVEHTDRATDAWTDGEEVDLNAAFERLTLRILSDVLFDLAVDPDGEDEPITRAARLLNELSGPGRSLTMYLPKWLPTPTDRRYRREMEAYEARLDELIAARLEAGTGPDAESSDDDLLSILLHAEDPEGNGLSETEVRDNMLTFMFAGHETTALGLSYTFMLLAEHDDVVQRLRGELETVLNGGRPGFEHVPELEYTEQVVREALRLYPPAFALFRQATEDAVVGGYRIPEGTILTLPQFHIHTDERFYDDPESFSPDRWNDDGIERPEYAYFPFGGGPRHCIGMRFAMLEMQLVVATVVREFDLTLLSDPDPAFSPGVTLRPEANVRVRVRRRSSAP